RRNSFLRLYSCADITFSLPPNLYSEQLRFMELTFNSEHFMRHQVPNLDPSQEFLESDHELVNLPQEVMNSLHNVEESDQGLRNSFQELMNFPQINSF
ncbi:3408_t:CDS:1, partial [Gigaspora rosea]